MEITVYGAGWCHDTQRTREYLDGLGIGYEFVDIDEDAVAEQKVLDANDGKRRIPLVEIRSGEERRLMRVPANEEMRNAIARDDKAA